jgi:hypothetical protein
LRRFGEVKAQPTIEFRNFHSAKDGCNTSKLRSSSALKAPAAARELLGKSRADLYPKWLRGTVANSFFPVVSRVPARALLGMKVLGSLQGRIVQAA